jgi:hypothetical protein
MDQPVTFEENDIVPSQNDAVLPAARDDVSKQRRITALKVALLCIGLSVASVVPFFFMGAVPAGESRWHLRVPATDDMWLHFDQMKSFYNGLAAGEIYPRWEEDTNRGFGAPTTTYYPPGIYYVTSALYRLTHDWMRTLLAMHVLLMIASGAMLYFYARQMMKPAAAAVAMAAYIVLPYHLIDQYYRGALAELLSFVWMPMMLFFIGCLLGETLPEKRGQAEWFGRRPQKMFLNIAGLAASYGAFLWSHPPTAYQFSLLLVPYILAMSIWRRAWSGLLAVGFAVSLGIGLSAVYVYPAAVEAELIRHEYVSNNWPYSESYVFARTAWANAHRYFFNLLDASWVITLAAIVLCAGAIILYQRRSRVLPSPLWRQVILWSGMGCIALFMMTRYSDPLGRHIPRLEVGVFSWRMLAVTALVASLLAGTSAQLAIDALRERHRGKLAWFGTLAALVVLGGAGFSTFRVMIPQRNALLFVPETEHINYAMIPRTTAPEDPEELPEPGEVQLAEVHAFRDDTADSSGPDPEQQDASDDSGSDDPQQDESPNADEAEDSDDSDNSQTEPEAQQTEPSQDDQTGTASVAQWKPQHREVQAEMKEDGDLWIRTFNFPGWTALVDGNLVEIQTGEDLGDMVISLPAGSHHVTLDYLDTPVRRRGGNITIWSFVILAAILISGPLLRLRRGWFKTARPRSYPGTTLKLP